jgi:hypothetical protein
LQFGVILETCHCNSEQYWKFAIQFRHLVELQWHISNFTNCNGISQNDKSCNGIFPINPFLYGQQRSLKRRSCTFYSFETTSISIHILFLLGNCCWWVMYQCHFGYQCGLWMLLLNIIFAKYR